MMVVKRRTSNHWWWFNFEPETFNQFVEPVMRVTPGSLGLTKRELKKRTLPTHDWGVFGEYEYLGAGTPYKAKQKARIRPVDDLDRIAESHDMWYAMSAQTPHGLRNAYRGVADYGAGAAMMTSAFNPWSDLDFKGRVLAFTAGDVLMLQGILRLNPATMLGMTMLDWMFY